MSKTYQTIDPAFYDTLQALVAKRAGVRLQFYSDIGEFITLHTTLKELVRKDEAEYLVLTTGEEVRLDRVVRVDDIPAPGYNEEFFKCDLGR
jgi:Rho-binding antiterminator